MACPSGWIVNATQTGCAHISIALSDIQVEFLIFLAGVFVPLLIALASKLFNPDSFFFSNTILLWGLVETPLLVIQSAHALYFRSTTIFVMSIIALFFLILCNVLAGIIQCRKISKDPGFCHTKKKHFHCYRFIHLLSVCWNFRVIRLYYSQLFGADAFKQSFKSFQENFSNPLSNVTAIAVIAISVPIIIVNLAGVAFWLPQDSLLKITCIGCILLELLMLTWISLELKINRNLEFKHTYSLN